jgi:hypothetical protein
MKVVKFILKWMKDALIETINQIFTILGFFTAWICLTDMAKVVTGWATIFAIVLWLLTIYLRTEE